MNNEVITKENERIKAFFHSLDKMLDNIETALADYKPMLNGERFLTDVQVAERLKVSRRTLQEYRTAGKIRDCPKFWACPEFCVNGNLGRGLAGR